MDPYNQYARFYDLDYGDLEDDLLMIQQFAARCGSPLLEMGCGTGRVLLSLARKGYQITGVDISPAMLQVARSKVEAEGLDRRVDLIQQDIRQLSLGQQYNLAVIALNSFSHLLTTEDQLAVLARVRQHLYPGGLFLIDLFNPDLGRLLDVRGQVILDKVVTDPDTGRHVMKYQTETVDLTDQILRVTFILDEVDGHGNVQRTLFPFSMRYLFRYELELLLRHSGFELEALYGSYDLDEFRADSEKMIAIARRPE